MAPKVLFSEVRGVVTRGGAPVSGAIVEREYRWSWNKSTGSDRATTGADGTFTLPPMTKTSLIGSLLPHEAVIYQTIRISVNGKSHDAWYLIKRNYETNGELSGRPIRLKCDLGAEPHRTDVDAEGTGFFGVCDLQ